MKKILVLATAAVLALVGTYASAQTVESANVVGYFRMDIISNTYNLLAVPMHKIPTYRGIITTNDATTVTDSSASWTVDQFAKGATNQEATGASTFYVEIAQTNSAFEGRYLYILSNNGTNLTIDGGLDPDIAPGDLAGAAYKIVPANRIRDIFGEPGSPKLAGAGSAGVADNIIFWNPSGGWATPIFYKTTPPAYLQNRWIRGTNIVDDLIMDRDESVFVKRIASAGTTNVTVTGEVSGNAQEIAIDPGAGYRFIGGMSAVDQAIGQTGLTNVLAGGGSAATADNVLYWVPGTGWAAPIFFKTTPPAFLQYHWLQGTNIVDNTFFFQAGRGYIFKSPTNRPSWTRNSPL